MGISNASPTIAASSGLVKFVYGASQRTARSAYGSFVARVNGATRVGTYSPPSGAKPRTTASANDTAGPPRVLRYVIIGADRAQVLRQRLAAHHQTPRPRWDRRQRPGRAVIFHLMARRGTKTRSLPRALRAGGPFATA